MPIERLARQDPSIISEELLQELLASQSDRVLRTVVELARYRPSSVTSASVEPLIEAILSEDKPSLRAAFALGELLAISAGRTPPSVIDNLRAVTTEDPAREIAIFALAPSDPDQSIVQATMREIQRQGSTEVARGRLQSFEAAYWLSTLPSDNLRELDLEADLLEAAIRAVKYSNVDIGYRNPHEGVLP